MKKVSYFFIALIVCLLLFGWQEYGKENVGKVTNQEGEIKNSGGNEGKEMKRNEYDIYDFSFIEKAPESKRKQDLNDVIKVLFEENDSSLSTIIAIDVENDCIYKEPRWSTFGVEPMDGTIKSNDAKNVIEILEKYKVQKWRYDYSVEDPESYLDGYSWELWLQFKDGTVEKHFGAGDEKDVIPKNFDEFVNELSNFVNERIGDN